MEIYLDTADLNAIKQYSDMLPLAGVTTNPSIAARADRSLPELLPAMRQIVGPQARLHAQVISPRAPQMVAEARRLVELDPDLAIKIPVTPEGYKAMKILSAEGITITATAIYSANQGFLAALCGASYVAPYVNRIDAMCGDGVKVVQDLQGLLDKHRLNCKVLAASFKNAQQALEVMSAGIESITLPVDVLAQMVSHPQTAPAVEVFEQDWERAFGTSLSYERPELSKIAQSV